MTSGARLRVGSDPELISYDVCGAEMDGRPLFQAEDELEHCYAGPDPAVARSLNE